MRPAFGVAMLGVQRGCLACKGIPVVLTGRSGMMGDEREKSASKVYRQSGVPLLTLSRPADLLFSLLVVLLRTQLELSVYI